MTVTPAVFPLALFALAQCPLHHAVIVPERRVIVETVGRAPSRDIEFAPDGALYSGTSISRDDGRTWTILSDAAGRRAVQLGGPHAIPPVVSREGRVLFAEILFDDPGTPLGQGPIAHAVEWNGSEWKILVNPMPEESIQPRFLVTDVTWNEPEKEPLVLSSDASLGAESLRMAGIEMGAATSFASALDLTLCVALREPAKFHLFTLGPPVWRWRPVATPGPVHDLAAGPNGLVYAACDQLGRRIAGGWNWKQWPPGFQAEHLAADLSRPLLAAWGGDRLVVSRDGGATMREIEPYGVIFAAWDPRRTDTLYVLRHTRELARVTLQ